LAPDIFKAAIEGRLPHSLEARAREIWQLRPASTAVDLIPFFGLGFGQVYKLDRRQPLARDGQVKNVEAIVISDDVVELLRLNTLRNVDVLLQEAFDLA
jgi:hypothetical protein